MANGGMTGIELILAIIPSLNEKEMQRLREAVGMNGPCAKNGHKFKKVGEESVSWFKRVPVMVCEKCGNRQVTY